VAQGRAAGLWSVLGISSGSIVHTLAAAFGLSAILATSAQAFLAVKLAGAAYLLYLGVRMLFERSRVEEGAAAVTPAERAWDIYRAGLLTNVLNPKVALFFLAFLPQFVAPEAAGRVAPFLFLGAVFIVNGTLWSLILVLCASALSARLRHDTGGARRLRRATGAVFVGLGARLALSK
jgi:threonine/homoserine/homoserine lactone efflux protein